MTHRLRRCVAITSLALLLISGASAAPPGDTQFRPDRIAIESSGQQLTIWTRRPEHPRGAVVLVHGRTWSARPAFNFQSRSGDRSLLKSLAAAGLATYAIDLPGYGASPRDRSGWLAPERAAEEVEATLEFVARRHADLPAPVLLGWSRGSKISALVATRSRRPLTALVLYAYNLDLRAPPDNGPASGKAPVVPNTIAAARSDFVSPAVASPALIQEFVDAALATDPVQADVCCDADFLGIRPESIHVPILMIYGARDPAFKPPVAAAFFARLGTSERRWVIIARGDHAAHLEDTAPEVTAAIIDFIGAALAEARK